MPGTGIGILSDWFTDQNERNIYVYWDITPDRRDERIGKLGLSYIEKFSARNIIYEHILYTYISRWIGLYYQPTPITERNILIYWCQSFSSSRYIYYYLDESLRYCYIHGLLTSTPLLLKYPKYYNWDKLPRVLTPEFLIWSYYDLDENSVVVKVMSDKGYNKTFSKNLTPDKISIEKISDKIYKITVNIDNVFEDNEEVSIYISCFDKWGNYLKPGLW